MQHAARPKDAYAAGVSYPKDTGVPTNAFKFPFLKVALFKARGVQGMVDQIFNPKRIFLVTLVISIYIVNI
jgi:hypothetical protein